ATAAGGTALALLGRTAAALTALSAASLALRGRLVVQAQRQRDALARDVHVEDLHLDDVARFDDVPRVLDEGLRHRGDMHQTVLVDTDVDEGAERGHVRHYALQDHPRGQVGELL